VSDVHGSAEWYVRVLGFERPRELPHARFERLALRHPDMPLLLTLVAHRDVVHDTFDETRTGLDHVAFGTRTPDDVDAWRRWLVTQQVPCSEVKDGALPGSRLVTFRDPDGIQVECYFSP
jgi:catechol 2,3-dioxygenase-like lactoylglutathione lyase family enzyme